MAQNSFGTLQKLSKIIDFWTSRFVFELYKKIAEDGKHSGL